MTGNTDPYFQVEAIRDRIPASTGYVDKAVSAQQGVQVDTSVGTRVFTDDIMIFGDTGKRSIGENFSHVSSNTNLQFLRRVGHQVQIIVHATVLDLAGFPAWSDIVTLPPGFRPMNAFRFAPASPDALLEITASGRLRAVTSLPQESNLSFSVMYFTDDPWPSTPV